MVLFQIVCNVNFTVELNHHSNPARKRTHEDNGVAPIRRLLPDTANFLPPACVFCDWCLKFKDLVRCLMLSLVRCHIETLYKGRGSKIKRITRAREDSSTVAI